MALAISLLFDAEATVAVEAVWASLAAAGVSRDMIDLDYPPHVTLVVVEDHVFEAQLSKALDHGIGQACLPLTIGPPKVFEGTTISWLACDGGAPLHTLHEAVCGTVPLDAIRPYYRPGQWTPHMTLQTIGDADVGRDIAAQLWSVPKAATAVRLEMASFVPVVRLGGVDLAY